MKIDQREKEPKQPLVIVVMENAMLVVMPRQVMNTCHQLPEVDPHQSVFEIFMISPGVWVEQVYIVKTSCLRFPAKFYNIFTKTAEILAHPLAKSFPLSIIGLRHEFIIFPMLMR